MNKVGKGEHVARMLKRCWIYEGKVSPTAFSLRPGIRETHVSVLREAAPTFKTDAIKVTKGKENTTYASLAVEELESELITIEKDAVSYEVNGTDNTVIKSHAGIFIAVNGHHIIGGEPFLKFIRNKNVSEIAILQAISKDLAAMAEKNQKTL